VIRDRLTRLKELGVCSTTQPDLSQKQLNEVRGRLPELIDDGASDGFAARNSFITKDDRRRLALQCPSPRSPGWSESQ